MQTENNLMMINVAMQVGILFLADAVIHGGQLNSSNFIADFGCSTKKLNEFHNELLETSSIQFQFRV